MIEGRFPRDEFTIAMAVYALGSTVGSGTALMIRGAIVGLVLHMDVIAILLIGDVSSVTCTRSSIMAKLTNVPEF